MVDPSRTAFLCCDVQTAFIDRYADHKCKLICCETVAKANNALKLPMVVTEQYKKVFGDTVPTLGIDFADGERVQRLEKTSFSMYNADSKKIFDALVVDKRVNTFVLFGFETHVCMQQTVIDLLNAYENLTIYVPIDATSSMDATDSKIALDFLRVYDRSLAGTGRGKTNSYCHLTSTESILFMLVKEGKTHPHFKAISALIKDQKERLAAVMK